MNKILTAIAQETLKVSTLNTRGSDQLDFYEVSVWQIKKALEEAYYTGMSEARAIEKNKSNV
jgi:hypothetical protein